MVAARFCACARVRYAVIVKVGIVNAASSHRHPANEGYTGLATWRMMTDGIEGKARRSLWPARFKPFRTPAEAMSPSITPHAKPARIGIVEDDPIIRAHLAQVIGRAADFELAGEASSVQQGRALLACSLDLLVLDLGLEDGSGLDLITYAAALKVPPRVLVLTVFGDETSVMSAIAQGAHGYLLKDSAEDSLLDNIAEVLKGGSPVSASVAAYLLRHMRQRPPLPEADSGLTTRELELLDLLARGLSNKEAAQGLGISPFTVGDHIKAIYRKLAVRSRGQAVYEAVNRGLIRK